MSLPSLAALPANLQPSADRALSAFRISLSEQHQDFENWPDERQQAFSRVTAASDFVAEQAQRDPAMLLALAACG